MNRHVSTTKPGIGLTKRILALFIFAILATVVGAGYLPGSGRLVPVASAQAQDSLWQEITPVSPVVPAGDQKSRPATERSKAFKLNQAALANLLAEAPMEFTEAARKPQNEITLPTPDGMLARFRFVESPIMEP